jgi:hypothetical protein
MSKPRTEFANGDSSRPGFSAYEGLAVRTGFSLRHIARLAEENRLNELFDGRGELRGRPLTPAEALRQIERRKNPSGTGLSPGAAAVILRHYMTRMNEQTETRKRQGELEVWERLGEIDAKRNPPGTEQR